MQPNAQYVHSDILLPHCINVNVLHWLEDSLYNELSCKNKNTHKKKKKKKKKNKKKKKKTTTTYNSVYITKFEDTQIN